MPRKSRGLDPNVVHPLPAAPAFSGREVELETLRAFWEGGPGVVSLVGVGGAGKTALTAQFLSDLDAAPPDGLLVWSFYEEPDSNAFLQAAYQYFTGGRTAAAHGAGWFYLLKEALSSGRRYLIVLDGLERVQRPETTAAGIYGEMDDPLLRGLLTRLAAGAGNTHAVITTRFPVADIERWRGGGYTLLDVNELNPQAAGTLLRSHGLAGTDEAFGYLTGEYGSHALTLDLLGAAIAGFFGGDADRLPAPEHIVPSGDDPQAARLKRVLKMYEQHLPAQELSLLQRLCIFRFGVDTEALASIFLGDNKTSISGVIAGASPADLQTWLDSLTERHLTLPDTRGRYTVHPAVRDYFYQVFREPQAVHQAVQRHLGLLTGRPGSLLPSSKEALELLEELIYHALKAGNVREAVEIYRHRMGGNDHLNAQLGEYARTFRILRAFDPCPDKGGMYHCLRALGRFREALEWRPQNRYITLLNGDLQALADDASDATRRFARFLRGEAISIPTYSPDMPVPTAMLHLYRGDLDAALRAAEAEQSLALYQDDVARNEIILAEIERRKGRLENCQVRLDAAAAWVLHSGSQEHLCLLHLMRARLAIDERRWSTANAIVDEGLHAANEASFTLISIELSIERARLEILQNHAPSAEASAREALRLARANTCRFAWGEAAALHVLGEALAAQRLWTQARLSLQQAADMRKHIGDPALTSTLNALNLVDLEQASNGSP